jgi:SAM-dependent methyltransferase
MLDWVEATVGRRPLCLDLGCGPGAVSERLLFRLPAARSVGVDYDPVLLRLGRSGLGTLNGRMTWVDADLRSRGWARAVPARQYDAALSSTALHWLTGTELTRFYRSVARLLRPGGILLNADQMQFPHRSPQLGMSARRIRHRRPPGRVPLGITWAEWWTAIMKEAALRPEVELRALRFPHEHMGTPTPDREGHVERLRRAGFREVEVVWSQGESEVLAAVR